MSSDREIQLDLFGGPPVEVEERREEPPESIPAPEAPPIEPPPDGPVPEEPEDREHQPLLFESDPDWKKLWEGMPEFNQRDLSPVKQLTVNFETEEDLAAFAKLVGQTVLMSTRSIWYPEAEIGHIADRRYVDGNGNGRR